MMRTPIDDPEAAAELVALVRRGGVLAVPTESSYGLGVDPRSRRGVDTLYAVKERERGKPLPVVVAALPQLALLGIDREHSLIAWAAERWPAALTVVVPTTSALPAAAGGDTLAVRIPAHAGLRRLLLATGPLTATSANLAGRPPLLDPVELAGLLAGHDAAIVDGGVLPGGPPSTLVAWESGGRRVLRYGAWKVAE